MTPVHELSRRDGQVDSKQLVCNRKTGMSECVYGGMETDEQAAISVQG